MSDRARFAPFSNHGGAHAALRALPGACAARRRRAPSNRQRPRDRTRARGGAPDRRALRRAWRADYPPFLREIELRAADSLRCAATPDTSTPAVAIVGSRNASAVGLAFTERLARGHRRRGLCHRLGAGARRRPARSCRFARDRRRSQCSPAVSPDPIRLRPPR